MQFLPSKSGWECALMRRFKPWWHGTLGPDRIRILHSITFASRRRQIRYEMNVDTARKPCIWRCDDESNCGRWNVNQVRVREGNRSGRWIFKCPCGKKKHMNSEDSLWASNQIDAWTIVADSRSIEE